MCIVQDWFWWLHEGDPIFNANFPDVPGELKDSARRARRTRCYLSGDFLIRQLKTLQPWWRIISMFPMLTCIDAHQSGSARVFTGTSLSASSSRKGWDAFWLDSAEPEEYWPHIGDAILFNKQLFIGNGARYTNIFPLLHTGGVQEHWKQTTDQKRVFLLTPLRLSWTATKWRHGLVRRCLQHVLGSAASSCCRPELCLFGKSLLDDRHRAAIGSRLIVLQMIQRTRSFIRGGSSSASSALSSAPTAIALTMSCGPTTRSSPRSCSMTDSATG